MDDPLITASTMPEAAATSRACAQPLRRKRPPRALRIALAIAAVALALLGGFVAHLLSPRNVAASGETIALDLADGRFETHLFCKTPSPRGIVILASGDGGWSYWEENTATHLADAGFAVGGWDCRKFADSRRYDVTRLGQAFTSLVDAVRERSGAAEDVPVWYGGWSTGAEQSVAAATLAERPRQLRGLLLAAPGTHGRCGITTSDLLGIEPSGPGTFALAEMAPKLAGLKVAQFAAGLDPMDDVDWIKNVPSPHLLFELPGKLHDMGNAGPEFQRKLDEAIAWTLNTAA